MKQATKKLKNDPAKLVKEYLSYPRNSKKRADQIISELVYENARLRAKNNNRRKALKELNKAMIVKHHEILSLQVRLRDAEN